MSRCRFSHGNGLCRGKRIEIRDESQYQRMKRRQTDEEGHGTMEELGQLLGITGSCSRTEKML